MVRLSANLGFLWQELSLPEAIRQAARAGFDAVECHWPFSVDPDDINAAVSDAGIPLIGLNTLRGDAAAGDNGLCALPQRVGEARDSIDQAVTYAQATGVSAIHVMAGIASGASARQTFMENLEYAAGQAGSSGITILIEPLNHHDAPGYFLQTSAQAAQLIEELNLPNVKLMFDCYHLQIMEGDLTRRLHALAPITGHIQFAGVPARSEPDVGELNYAHLFQEIEKSGYTGFVGAEYKPTASTDEGLGWMTTLR
ncbi:MAG: TIM barrel protein [Gammaproteobacteria bacterium]|nr:TIM barrel protein [Gammaproteobacteria bacterium]